MILSSPTSWSQSLARSLRGEVLDDAGTRALYATDASNHRVVPRCVVFPRDAEDIAAVLRACTQDDVPVTGRGAGTNCAGNAIGPGVVLDLSRHMNQPPVIDPEAGIARVQPGLVLDRLQEAAAPYQLFFGVDPSTHSRCTLGGMIGTNACGSHSVAWGTTADNVESLDVLLADGTATTLVGARAERAPHLEQRLLQLRDQHLATIRTDLGRFPRQLSGYGLQHLTPERGSNLARAFVGSEGTCGLVTAATVRLHQRPVHRALVVLGFPDEVGAAVAAPQLVRLGALTVEGMDSELAQVAADRRPATGSVPLPSGAAWLLVELGAENVDGLRQQADNIIRTASDLDLEDSLVLLDTDQQRAVWAIREHGAGLASRSPDGTEFWPGWEDAAVPPERLGTYLADFRALMARHDRRGMVYGHFGEGCLHVRIDHDLLTDRGRASYRAFQEEAAALVASHGGSLSGEHGDGRARSELLSTLYGTPALSAFRDFKTVFDPDNILNPGILVDPDPLDGHLRGAHLPSATRGLGFLYPTDDGDFGKALRRCTGVGACRKTNGGGMCPSYRATQDEQHSTRGRARLLTEMIDGEVLTDSWKSEAVAEALDLCLSCKACSSECPVGVDMATYKAEFLHQRFRRRLRPRSHYSMGWLPVFLAFGRLAPKLANQALRPSGLRHLVRRLGGIDRNRELPVLAEQSVPRWSRRRPTRKQGGDPVLLWSDCFTSTFSPGAAQAAVLLLEEAGYRVTLAPSGTCCGLTWLSTGQLDVARHVMSRTVRRLDGPADVPVVTLEPSCAAAVRHDGHQILGDHVSALSDRIRSLSEALVDRDLRFTNEPARAVNQLHCHQRATVGADADRQLAQSAGIEMKEITEGCCGMAGNFGFETGHYEISVACAEEALLPAIRDLDPDDLLIADGFSCRLQAEQLARRRPQHLAEVLLDRLIPTARQQTST